MNLNLFHHVMFFRVQSQQNYYSRNLYEHTSLGSPKNTLCRNLMKYHGTFIENSC